MIRFLAKPRMNYIDVYWLALTTLAWRDGNWIAMAIFVLTGSGLSALATRLAKRRHNT